jgi:hypothetical protein
MLSGGLDSRLLAAVLGCELPSTKAISMQWASIRSNENKLAQKIAEALGLEFFHFKANSTDIVSFIQSNISLSDGVWGFYELVPFIKKLRNDFPQLILLNGFLMDTLFRSAWAFFPNREGRRRVRSRRGRPRGASPRHRAKRNGTTRQEPSGPPGVQ